MSTTRRFTTVALAMLLGAGLLASPVHAELPKEPRNVAVMDANKDGKIDRVEYLDYMGTLFDKRRSLMNDWAEYVSAAPGAVPQ